MTRDRGQRGNMRALQGLRLCGGFNGTFKYSSSRWLQRILLCLRCLSLGAGILGTQNPILFRSLICCFMLLILGIA
jgi:hypothetical protein